MANESLGQADWEMVREQDDHVAGKSAASN